MQQHGYAIEAIRDICGRKVVESAYDSEFVLRSNSDSEANKAALELCPKGCMVHRMFWDIDRHVHYRLVGKNA